MGIEAELPPSSACLHYCSRLSLHCCEVCSGSQIDHKGKWEASPIQFADDPIICFGASNDNVQIKAYIILFRTCIRISINLQKTKIFYISKMLKWVSDLQGFVHLPISQLRIPILDHALIWSSWEALIARSRKGWKTMSFYGRVHHT